MKAHLALLLTGAFVLSVAYGAPSKSTMSAPGIQQEASDSEQSTSLSADTTSPEIIGDWAPAPEMSESQATADKSVSPSSMTVSERMKARRDQIALMGFASRTLKADPKPVHKMAPPEKKTEDLNTGTETSSEETSSEIKQGRSMQHGSKFSNRRSNSQNSMKQQPPPAFNNGNISPAAPAAQPAPAAHRTPMRRNNPASRSSPSWNGNGNNAPAAPAAPSMPQKSMGMSSPSGKRNWSPGARKAKEMTAAPTEDVIPETAEAATVQSPPARDSRSMRRMPSRRMSSPSTSDMMAAERLRGKRSPTELLARLGKRVSESTEPEINTEMKEKSGPRKIVMRRTVGAAKPLEQEDKSTEKLAVKVDALKKTVEENSAPQVAGEEVSSEAPLEKHDEQVLKQTVEKVNLKKKTDDDDDDDDDRKSTKVHVHSADCHHKHDDDEKDDDDYKPSEPKVVVLPANIQKTVSLVRRTQSVSSSADEPIIEQFRLVNEKSQEPREAEKEAATSAKTEEPKKEEVKPVEEVKKTEEPKKPAEEAVPVPTGDSKKSEEPKVAPESDKKAVKVETTEKPEEIPATTDKPEESAEKTEVKSEESSTEKKTEEGLSKKPAETKTPTVTDEFEAEAQKEAELAESILKLGGGLDPQALLVSTETRGVDGGREPQTVNPAFVRGVERDREPENVRPVVQGFRKKRDAPSSPPENGMARVKMGEEGMPARNMPMMRRRRSTGYGQKIRNSVRSSGNKQGRTSVRAASYETPAAEPETYIEALPAVRSSTYGRSLSRAAAPIRSSNYEAPAEAAPSTYEAQESPSSYETPADPEETYTESLPAIRSTNYEAPPAPLIRSTFAAPSTYEASATPVILSYFPVASKAPPATRSSTYGKSLSRVASQRRSSNHEAAAPAIRTSTYEEEAPASPEESHEIPSAPEYDTPQAPAAYPEQPTRLVSRGRPPVRTAPASSAGAPGAPGTRGAASGARGAAGARGASSSSSRRPSTTRHAVRHSSSSSHDSSPTFEEVAAAIKSLRSSSAQGKSRSAPRASAHRVKSQDDSYGSSLFDEVDTTNYGAPASPAHHDFQEESYTSQEVVLDEETSSDYSPPHVPTRKLPIRISKERYRRSLGMGKKTTEKPAEAEPTTPAPKLIKDFDDSVLSKLSEKRPSPMKSVTDVLVKKATTKAA